MHLHGRWHALACLPTRARTEARYRLIRYTHGNLTFRKELLNDFNPLSARAPARAITSIGRIRCPTIPALVLDYPIMGGGVNPRALVLDYPIHSRNPRAKLVCYFVSYLEVAGAYTTVLIRSESTCSRKQQQQPYLSFDNDSRAYILLCLQSTCRDEAFACVTSTFRTTAAHTILMLS